MANPFWNKEWKSALDGEEWKFRPEGRAAYLIGKAPPDEVRMYLPWAGHSPNGEEMVSEAARAWEQKQERESSNE